MTKFKICGISEVEHAVTARESGADWIGFVFVPGVRREISVERAKEVLAKYRYMTGSGGPDLVGLFANQTLEDVDTISEKCDLDYVQLCGDEDHDYWRQLDIPVIRQIKVATSGDRSKNVDKLLHVVGDVLNKEAIPLLDRLERGKLGGTGKAFDWSMAAELPADWDYVLAGGLNADNVVESIKQVNPWAVDVSTGVETNGRKDTNKIKDFANKVLNGELSK